MACFSGAGGVVVIYQSSMSAKKVEGDRVTHVKDCMIQGPCTTILMGRSNDVGNKKLPLWEQETTLEGTESRCPSGVNLEAWEHFLFESTSASCLSHDQLSASSTRNSNSNCIKILDTPVENHSLGYFWIPRPHARNLALQTRTNVDRIKKTSEVPETLKNQFLQKMYSNT